MLINRPIEHAEELHDAFLPTGSTNGRRLDLEPVNRPIVAVYCETTEVHARRPRDVEFVCKVTDANEVSVIILVLYRNKSGQQNRA